MSLQPCPCFCHSLYPCWGFRVAQTVKNLPAMEETQVRSLKEDMASHLSILAWRIPWREEPSRLQSMGSQRVGHNEATNIFTFFHSLAEENPVFQKKLHLLRTCTHLSRFCTDSFSYCVAFNRSRILKQTNKNWTNASCLLGSWWKSKVWP